MPSLWQSFKAKLSNLTNREETPVHAPNAQRGGNAPAQATQDHIYGRFVPPSNAPAQARGEIYANAPRQPNAPAQPRGEIYANAPRVPNAPAQPRGEIYANAPRVQPNAPAQPRGEIYANAPRVQPNAPAQPRGEIYANAPRLQPNAPAPSARTLPDTQQRANPGRQPKDNHAKIPVIDGAPARHLPNAPGPQRILAQNSASANDHGHRSPNTVQRGSNVDRGRK